MKSVSVIDARVLSQIAGETGLSLSIRQGYLQADLYIQSAICYTTLKCQKFVPNDISPVIIVHQSHSWIGVLYFGDVDFYMYSGVLTLAN